MPYPHFEDSPAYEDALSDLRTLKWLEQQRRNGEIDVEQLEEDEEDEN